MTIAAASLSSAAHATTKGLNQIVTPDVQPLGSLSLSYQQVDPNISNPSQVQVELGVAKEVELAFFQGFAPSEQIGGLEVGLIDKHPYLLSTGFINWSSKGVAPQPFLEAGFYQGNTELIAGIIDGTTTNTSATGAGAQAGLQQFQPFALGSGGSATTSTGRSLQAIIGYAYRVHPRTLLQVDYQSGNSNFATAGFTYNITPQLQFNPALYVSNSAPTKGYAYAVLTWNITAWGGGGGAGSGGGSGSASGSRSNSQSSGRLDWRFD